MKKDCKRCGYEFDASRSNVLYCNDRCKRCKSIKNVKDKVFIDSVEGFMKKECVVCGNEFNTVNAHKYTCSKNCYKKHWVQKKQSPESKAKREQWKLSEGRYSALKKRVVEKGFSYVMPSDKYFEIVKQDCFYCGKSHWGVEKGVGLDRKDSNKGYTEDNVVSCCGDCNRSKSNVHTSDSFKAMMSGDSDRYIEVLELIKNAQKNGDKMTLEEFMDKIRAKYSPKASDDATA